VTTDHWYLTVLGVEPERQNQGIGGALMQPLLARADAEGLPCYLETLSERNLLFYRRNGFEVTFSGEVPDGGPMAWAMVRQPR
jgi:ribosomal protein S18 acetylase RimI-like enzyme